MNNASYIPNNGQAVAEDPYAAAEIRKIDRECAFCLYEAAMLSEKEVLEAVIANELNESEQLIVKLHWFEGLSLNQISTIYGIPKENIRRTAEKAKNKIYNSMKYVVLYDELLDGKRPIPKDFRFKIIRCTDGKELVS